MRIAVDVMGGDYAPGEIIAGAIKWASRDDKNQVLLVGNSDLIEKELSLMDHLPDQVDIVHAGQVIGMEESPALALRKKRDASIVIATGLVKQKQAEAVLSCGSTGAQMAAAVFILGRMKGIERPPIVTPIPGAGHHSTLLIDSGANVDCKPVQLLQFGVLGSTYASSVMGISRPRVALLNNGQEEGKGNNVAVQGHDLLKQQSGLHFIGNVEGRDLFADQADVVVCDGFTGNIILKVVEGLAGFMSNLAKEELGKVPASFGRLDYRTVGGAPLLGVEGISIVCHGSSRREAVFNGMLLAQECIRGNIVERQMEGLNQALLNLQ